MSDHQWGFHVRGEATDAMELDIYDVVGGGLLANGDASAKRIRAALKDAKQAKAITVRINSAGGNVLDGMAIYSQLKDHPAKVTVYVDALAASIASVIAMAGDEIVMAENAFMMIHNPYGLVVGDAEDMRHHAEVLDKMRASILDVYEARTGAKRAELEAAIDAETWMTADEAKERGFATRIVPLKKKAGAEKAAAAWNLAPFANVPNEVRALQQAQSVKVTEPRRHTMFKECNAILGLQEDAPQAEAIDAVKLAASAREGLLEATGKTSVAAALGTVAAWKTRAALADELEAKAKAQEVAQRASAMVADVDAAVEDGRLPPAKRDATLAQAQKHGPEWLAAHLELLEPVVQMQGAGSKQPPPRLPSATDPEIAAAAGQVGLTVNEYLEWAPKAEAYFRGGAK